MKKETDSLNAKFDRSYEYDFSSRMTKALTGAEARGGTDSYTNIPYHNTYGYDAYALGEKVRKDPILLKGIGELIKSQFCK